VLELRWSLFCSLIWPISWFIVSFQFNHRSSLGSSGPAFLLLAGALLVGSAPVKALTVTPSVDANAMAIALLGPGVSLVPGSAVYTGASNSSGFFAGDTTIFGDLAGAKGVLLTSGAVTNALPPNDFPNASQDNGLLGSADLDALVGGDTLDASVLSFKVKLDPGTSGIQWKYSFGSEEYLEYVGTRFNDVFGLFLNGVNLALLPGGSTPVSINSVNDALNSSYYRDNPLSVGDYGTQYDGLTVVLASVATGLDPEVEHLLSFQIADRDDRFLDSGVFIQGKSIKDPEDVPTPLPMLGMISALASSRKLRRRVALAKLR
jgi:hypothetical protein